MAISALQPCHETIEEWQHQKSGSTLQHRKRRSRHQRRRRRPTAVKTAQERTRLAHSYCFPNGRSSEAWHGYDKHGGMPDSASACRSNGPGTALSANSRAVPCHQARWHVSARASPDTKPIRQVTQTISKQ